MSTMDINELERRLADNGDDPERPDLPTIHRLGLRRRRRRSATAVGGAVVVTLVAVLGAGAFAGESEDDLTVATDPPVAEPDELSAVAARALAEVRGAAQVSPWQVVIPAPEEGRSGPHEGGLVGEPARMSAHHYAGVTSFKRGAFPSWLQGDPDSAGVLVDLGPAFLGCIPTPHNGESFVGASCWPGIYTKSAAGWVRELGLGSEDFLTPGAPMEVFLTEDFATGREKTAVVAGVDGTAVARVELITTEGTVVEGTVESGTVVPGDSLFHGTVDGDLATVVTYDGAGNVLEEHPIEACDTPVECEVR